MAVNAVADIGALRERVVIQSNTTTPDSQGGRSSSWGTFATVWAAVTPLSGSERLAAQSLGSTVTYRVQMRYRADITPSMRLSWTPYGGSAKTLQVLAVRSSAGGPWGLELDCGEAA